MKTLGQRIRERRKELELTQAKVGKLVGVSSVSVTQWEKDETSPRGENLVKLAKVLDCEVDWLLEEKGRTPIPRKFQNAVWMGYVDTWEEGDPLKQGEVELPFYTEVQLSTGKGTVVKLDEEGRKSRCSAAFLEEKGLNPKKVAWVTVKGSSMAPVLPNGSYALIDTANTVINDGDLYGIDHNGMLLLRLIYRVPGGGIRLRTYNSNEYPDEVYTEESSQGIRILGRVFWYIVSMI
ncbi:helix-turn-helix transcriptional regulator [Hahella aquimaris]|uniref:helix-turn-helix transcriptional regulator n=1 Tax=unclassified Hahella TaxID=2624107 RepID=UPI0024427DF1|nr:MULTISPECIES: helix-turn-helix transcriptional regulator [unclassified Hahella]MDG9671849.1 helix-turn-helix transcriptional regulator [Hahella sp. CR1]WLQ15613.1 helix-turn-helix transcriptional regulator [Hahella sp. HNIBRBA332]